MPRIMDDKGNDEERWTESLAMRYTPDPRLVESGFFDEPKEKEMGENWIVISIVEEELWFWGDANVNWWTRIMDDAERFSQHEKESFHLPMGENVQWIKAGYQ